MRPEVPHGAWPILMPAAVAAGYLGEVSVEAFLRRVGKDYPKPVNISGRRRVWARKDLDAAVERLQGRGEMLRDARDVL